MNHLNIFDILIEEHNRFRHLFKEIMSRRQKGETFEVLRKELDIHMRGEEEYFYPVTVGALKEKTLESIEEHHTARLLMEELVSLTGREEVWMAKLKVLQEVVAHHLDEEEQDLFPPAKQIIGDMRQQELADKYMQFEAVPHG